MTAYMNVNEKPKPASPSSFQLLMVALNQPFSGQIAGTIGADHMCMRQANDIGLDGTTFRSFLSSDHFAIKDFVQQSQFRQLPIANFKVRTTFFCFCGGIFRSRSPGTHLEHFLQRWNYFSHPLYILQKIFNDPF